MKRLALFYILILTVSFSCKKEDPILSNKNTAITISSPVIRSQLEKGKKYDISWHTTKSEKLKIELFKGQHFVQNISVSEPNTGNFQWLITHDLKPDSLYRLKITCLENKEITAYSHFFTIIGDSTTKNIIPGIIYNNNWIKGSDCLINWDDNINENVRIDLFLNGILYMNIVEETLSNGTYAWSIPTNLPTSSNYRFKVSSIIHTDLYGLSDVIRISMENEVNLVKNGNFSSDSLWYYSNAQVPGSKRWNIRIENNSGVAQVESLQSYGSILQDLNLIPGKQYIVNYTLTPFNGFIGGAIVSSNNINRAAIICMMGSNTGTRRYATGSYSDTITANGSSVSFNIIDHPASSPNSGFLCKLDNVEVFEN
ncbi:MAG: hypothetical protein H0V01_03825 [Bacteroidetes bacterium]|nr:hypothetical protein [Bacteroidota bacterium]HET6243562.1 Ser-Thr-rich GPI-anchored membrane family protein [Bacteroidia bacterium]